MDRGLSSRESGAPSESGPAEPDVIHLVVADDHPLYRVALVDAIGDDPRMQVLAVATDGQQALDLVLELHPEVAVLDVRMPRLDGREVAQLIRQAHSSTRILFISEYHGGELVLQALTAGGSGYLSKTAEPDAIRSAVMRVATGGSVLPTDVGNELAEALRVRGEAGARSSTGARLTKREAAVLARIADGRTAAAIAEDLSIALPTAKTHIQNLYAKLGVGDRGAAVAEAMRLGLLR